MANPYAEADVLPRYDQLPVPKHGIELLDEALDAVAGGYLFQDYGSRGIEIIRDSDGEYLGSVDTSNLAPGAIMEEARKQAVKMGQSADWIYG